MKTILSVVLALFALQIQAAVRIWEGDVSTFFSNTGNWSPAGLPGPNDDLVFPQGAARTTISNDITGLIVRSLTFDSGYYVQGRTITISNGITCSQSGQNVVLETSLIVGADQTFLTADDNLLLTGSINVNGKALRLEPGKNTVGISVFGQVFGNGTLLIQPSAFATDALVDMSGSPANGFSGTTIVRSGKLLLNRTNLPAINGPLEIGVGSVLGEVLCARDNQINSSVPVSVRVNGRLSLQGHVQKLNDLRMTGGVVDSGAATGVLELGSSVQSFAAATAAFLRGRVRVTLAPDQTFPIFDVQAGASPPMNIQANLEGVGFWKNGVGILLLSGTNTFTDDLVVNDGYVEAGNPSAFGSALVGTTLRGGGLRLNDIIITNEALIVEGNALQLTGIRGSSIINSGSSTWTGPITLESNLFIFADNMTLSGTITGTGGIDSFYGTLRFTGSTDNTFTGELRVLSSLVSLAKSTGKRSMQGPVQIGGAVAANTCELRWINSDQCPPQFFTLHTNGFMNLFGEVQRVDSLYFHGGRVSTGFGTLTVNSDIFTYPTNFTAIIDGELIFPSFGHDITVGDGPVNFDLELRALTSAGGINKYGDGLVYISNANVDLGEADIFEGIIQADHIFALGDGTGEVDVHDGGTLRLAVGASPFAPQLILRGQGHQGTWGALTGIGAPTQTNKVTLGSATTVRVDAPWVLGMHGAVTSYFASGTLIKKGDGTLTLGGSLANTYLSDTFVDEGTLRLSKLGPGITAIPHNLIIGRGGFGSPPAAAELNQHNQVFDSVTVNRNGLLDLNGFNDAINRLTLNEGGDVQTGAGTLSLFGGDALSVNPGLSPLGSSISGQLSLVAPDNRWQINPLISGFGDVELDIPARIAGSFSLDKNGAGTMRLSGNNIFGNTFNVNAGTVIAASSAALGDPSGSTYVKSNAVLVLENGITSPEPIILNSATVPSLISQGGSNVCSGRLLLFQDSVISVTTGHLQLLGPCEGFGLTKLGAGTLQFWGTATNTYSGLTIVKQGVLEAGRIGRPAFTGDAIIGDNTTNLVTARIRSIREQQFSPTAEVTINTSGSLDILPTHLGQNMPPSHETFRSLRGAGFVAMGTSNSLTFSNNVPFEFAGFIGGSGSLNKRGTAKATMTGNGLFTGPTYIHEGEYEVHGNYLNSPITVGLLARLSGDGAVNMVEVGAFSTLSPSSEVVGQLGGELELTGLAFSFFGNLELDFFGPHATGGNERLAVVGNVNLGNGFLTPHFRYAPREGEVLTLIRKVNSGSIVGEFDSWPQGTTRVVDGIPVRINYTGGDSNDVTLTVTNLAAGSVGVQVASGNGNGLIEPDECNLVSLVVTNRRNIPIVLSNVVLRSVTPGAFVTIAQSSYPTIPAFGTATNLTPFQLRTTPDFPCNTPVVVELDMSVTNEGRFSVAYTLAGGTNCNAGGGGCESCFIVANGQIINGLATMTNRFALSASPSICYPPKPCPGPEALSTGAVRYATHRFTNNTETDICVTALLRAPCTNALQRLHAAAYRTVFSPVKFCDDYLGDSPTPGAPFSFTIPRFSSAEIVVCESSPTNACASYTLEVFGLPCPAPTLHIAQDVPQNKVITDWSTAYPGWRLQSANSLTVPPLFVDAAGVPSIVNSRFTITNVPVGSNRFYRLTK